MWNFSYYYCMLLARRLASLSRRHQFRTMAAVAEGSSAKKARTAGFFDSVAANVAGHEIVSKHEELKTPADVTIGTHSGTFHCDEALACAMLKCLPEFSGSGIPVIRTRDSTALDECSIVVDVGGVYEHEKRRYDHHQRTFDSTMAELGFKTKLSSAGLVYRHYGREIIQAVLKAAGEEVSEGEAELLYKDMYKSFVEHVDGIDNGVNAFTGDKNYDVSTTLSSRVGELNPAWNEESSPAKACARFRKAMELTLREFCGKLEWKVRSVLPARAIVRDAVRNSVAVKSPGGEVFRIAVLKQYCPWKDALYDEEKAAAADAGCDVASEGQLLYMLYPENAASPNSSRWRVQAIPVSGQSFESRKKLPEPWRGLRDEELSKLSGVDGSIFIHAAGFIGGNKSFEGAMELAKKAIAEFE